ncbi:A/G-specific adenine glycosylase [Blochmannia endosymbiont of Polyrhachis (Hedomyrma) turneri]|uniref:A/G-specific adenine glycosylase n=1 Tax=Blochmannia endosymbiont of Polyrhachis (Hedomyrma) turneri TaxID=1505596 RepID=UPI00061A6039|nr:A/G-specific adenine glycosylase [Blochmannia endosymbiont of Polyrhachis (Hedomyrma) turneri]AKC59819.1 A/G-specific adenine glycosylase [Blochmannia endosymbiont of Polyrhachis (Hedomyrma) turneri]
MTIKSEFSKKIIHWYNIHGRKTLPWQIKKTPYTIWVSEIMLQQTQIIRVLPFFNRFINKFPNIITLAKSELNTVLHVWSGLGYYTRAHNLYKTAKIIVNKYYAVFPADFSILITLPGIGRSTAGAILSLALEKSHPILDSNVKRILTRYHIIDGCPKKNKIEKKLWIIIDEVTPHNNISKFNQGLMDLGEMICTIKNPKCPICPLNTTCQANLNNIVHKYPNKQTQKTTFKKNLWLLILQYKNTVWIEQCLSGKIWKGLFCFPQFKTQNNLNHWLIHHNLNPKQYTILPLLQHTLSNYHIYITPIIFTLNKILHLTTENKKNTGLWFDLIQPQTIGFPQPMLKLLQQINYLK